MKKIIKLMSVLLVFCMLFSMVACGSDAGSTDKAQNGNDAQDTTAQGGSDTGADNAYADIAGEYLLDASNLGMPMKWYIKVTADGKFQIATTRDYATLKGEGTVGGKDGTYMLVYSDSTTDAPKTATFKFEGKNMVFSTNVPIGAASVSPNLEEEKYPTAKLIANEDILGTYLGTYEKQSAMAGNVTYSYELTLEIGNEYAFASSFVMGGTEYVLTETGAFDVKAGEITFAPAVINGEAVTVDPVKGTIADGKITAEFKLSQMAGERQKVEAKFAVYADIAGTYSGNYNKEMMGTLLNYFVEIDIDAFGGYKYTSYDNTTAEAVYSEEGTYTYDNGKFTFTANTEGAAAVEATLENYVISTKMKFDAQYPMAATLTFYGEQVYGPFTAEVEHEGKIYKAAVSLDGGTFMIMVGEKDAAEPAYLALGTYTVKKAMLTTVEFVTTELYTDTTMTQAIADIPAELKAVSAPVADSGINAELPFDVDDSTLLGFQLEKMA